MGDGCTTQFQRKGKTVLRICFLIILKPLIQMVDAVAISANNIYIRQSGKIAFLLNENIDICKTIKLLGGLNMQFLSTIWIFIQDQILGMKWLSSLIGEFLYSIGLDTSGKIGGSVQFFIYDVIKIVFLLCMLIFIISYIQSFFPPERTKRILGTFHGIGANVLAALLGTVIEKLHLENQVEEFIRNAKQIDILQEELTVKDRIKYAWEQVVETLKKVFPYILVGVGIGAFIHNWIPEDIIVRFLGTGNPFGVIIATIVGVPMYADIFGCIPIAEALLAKGARLGVVLSFMMGVTTLSLPSMIMLKKAIKPKLLGLFIGICIVGIIIVGYAFNAFQYLLI